MERVVVIGAGVEGLTAAATLAAAGRRVTVFEAASDPGGLCAGIEFAPGYRHVGLWHHADTLRPAVVAGLGLTSHGLRQGPAAPIFAASPSGGVHLDDAGLQARGGEGAVRWRAFVDAVSPFLRRILDTPAPDVGCGARLWPLAKSAWGLRRLGRPLLHELLRIAPAPVEDALAEHFDDPLLRAALAGPALVGTWMGPRSPQGAALLLRLEALRTDEVRGGPAAIVRALVGACAARGVEIQCDAPVARIRTDGRVVHGVTLADGADVDATTVLSTVGPRETLFGLIDPTCLPPRIAQEAARIRTRGTFAKIHLALSRPLSFHGGGRVERAWCGPHPDDLERCFDDVKYRRLPRRPVLDVRVPTVADPSLAPDGHEVVSIATTVSHALDDGWTDATRETLTRRVLDTLQAFTDLSPDAIVAVDTVTPADLTAALGHDGGHPLHAELALDQLWAFRPAPALARYAAGIDGLYLGSTGQHPGAVGSGGSGLFAARRILDTPTAVTNDRSSGGGPSRA